MVFLTPISTLSKSMNTAMRVLRFSVVMFIDSRIRPRVLKLLWKAGPSGPPLGPPNSIDRLSLALGQLRALDLRGHHARELTALQPLTALAAPSGHFTVL